MDYKKIVAKAIFEVLSDYLTQDEIYQLIEIPKYEKMGDLAFPCFTLAKVLRQAPNQIAADVVSKINNPYIEKQEAVGPYMNFFLAKDKVSNEVLSTILKQGANYGQLNVGNNETVVIDLSAPNIAKPMSMGHLRSTVIGNALNNIMQKVGYQTVKVNHLGDWGTQFGKLIVAYKLWGSKEAVLQSPITELLRIYVKFHEQAETNPALEDDAREWFKKMEDGDKEALELWEWFREESLKEFTHVYDKLEVTFDSYNGEAFYNDKMDKPVTLLEEKGLLKVDNGATIVDLEKYNLNPALIKKSDGATLYMTRDLAAAMYRKETYNFAKALYVVGNEQSNHFKQLKAVLKEANLQWGEDLHHIAFGLITQNGKKLSTRKGKIVLLNEVLEESATLALSQIEAKNPTLENKETVAKQVGYGAVVFHDLKNDRLNNFDFKLEEVVQFEGETGPYVQYSRVRALSILRKVDMSSVSKGELSLTDDYAWEIVKQLRDFPTTIKRASELYEPSVIAKYVISLAQAFNKYYANSTVLAQDKQLYARLVLVQSVADVLKEGMRLLGIQMPDEM